MTQTAALPARKTRRASTTPLLVMFVLLLATALRLPSLGSPGYSLDELWTAELASGRGSAHLHIPRNTLVPTPPELFHLDPVNPWWTVWSRMECTHPPLYFVGLRLWMQLVGEGDARERLFSVVTSLIAIALLFDIARLLHGPGVAAWACVLMAVAQPQIEYARSTRNYAMLLMMALATADALVRIEMLGANRKRIVALSLGVLATLLTHYFCAGFLVGLAMYAMIKLPARQRWRALAAFVIAGIIFAGVWGPFMWRQRALFSTADEATLFLRDRASSHFLSTLMRLAITPTRLLVEPAKWRHLSAIGAVLYIAAMLLLRRNPKLLLWVLWLGFTVGLVAVLDLSRSTTHLELVRYFLLAGPPVCALIPALSATIGFQKWIAHAGPALATALCLLALPHAYRPWIADPNQVVADFGSDITSKDCLVFIDTGHDSSWVAGANYMMLSRYLHPLPCPIMLLDEPATGTALETAIHSRHIFAFTQTQDPRSYIPGKKLIAGTQYQGRGLMWQLANPDPTEP